MPLLALLDPSLMAQYAPRPPAPPKPVAPPPAAPGRPGRRKAVSHDPQLAHFNARFVAAGHPADSLRLTPQQQVAASFDEWRLRAANKTYR